jgi:hypothetical protein
LRDDPADFSGALAMADGRTLVRRSIRCAVGGGVAFIGLAASGCLHLGGGTTYVQEDKAASSRMASLERRMEVLESAIIRTASAELPEPSSSTRISDDPAIPDVPAPELLPSYPSSN